MRTTVLSLLLLLALLAAACSSSDDDPSASTSSTTSASGAAPSTTEAPTTTGTSPAPSTTAGSVATTASGADDDAPDDSTDDNGETGFAASLDDPAYVDLILDCVYGENEAGSCEQLESAGLSADDAYGLGNSMSQAPNEALRSDCVDGVGIACAEINLRVQLAVRDGDTVTLLCFFHDFLTGDAPDDLDAFYEGELLGADAPGAVGEALFTLVEDPTNAELIAIVDGYVGPICA